MNKKILPVILSIILALSAGCNISPETLPDETETPFTSLGIETADSTEKETSLTTTAITTPTAETTTAALTSKAVTATEHDPYPDDISSLGLIIDYKDNIEPSLYEGKIPIKYGEGSETVLIIPKNQSVPRIKLYKTYLDDKTICVSDIVFEVSYLPDEYYIEYSTYIPDFYPAESIFVGDSGYRLAYDTVFSGGVNVIKADIDFIDYETYYHWSDPDDHDKLSDYLSGIQLSDYAELVLIGEDDTDKSIAVKYPDNTEPFPLFLVWSNSYFDVSPDRTRIASIESSREDDFLGPFYIFNVPTRQKTLITEFDKPKENLASKDLLWLNNEILLLTAGQSNGTMTRGGDLFYYNPETGEKAKIINTIYTKGSLTEISDIKLNGEYLDLEICVTFYHADCWFFYTDRIPVSQVYDLIRNKQTLEFEAITIEDPDR